MSALAGSRVLGAPLQPARGAWYRRITPWRPGCTLERLILLVSLFLALACNGLFWDSIFAVRPSVRMVVSVLLVLIGVHGLLLGLIVWRWNARVLLTLLLIVSAVAAHYMNNFHVYLDVSILRSVLLADSREGRDHLSLALVGSVLVWGGLPSLLVWRLRLRQRSWGRALASRAGFLLGMVAIALGGIWMSFQDLSALIRNQREVRYLVTPANYLVGVPRVLWGDSRTARVPRMPVGTDAVATPRPATSRPRLLVLVVGETARAQNWGLNGYARQTTPELARLDLINFPDMHACGTNTEVSLPCMFSHIGRRNYDEDTIRSHQSLLHVLEHAGITTLWRDNQTGCKGACDGLETHDLRDARHPDLCVGSRCFDEILMDDLSAEIRKKPGDRVIVLHQLGNHGPTYHQRYPERFRRFVPTCDTAELGRCSREAIVNSYDNALLYTDAFLARLIRQLDADTDYDTAMVYVSDHGESLGEKGVYLHGLPYSIAPREQTHIPMTMWFSSRFARERGLDLACLRQRAQAYTDHDVLFSSVLGLMQVKTALYERELDLFAGCERSAR